MRRAAAALLVALVGLTGCVQTFDASKLGVPVTMASAAGAPAQGTPFTSNGHSVHFLFGLFTISAPNLQKALNRQLIGAGSVADLRIKVRSRWSDVLFTVLTGGLIVPRTVTYQGVIVEP